MICFPRVVVGYHGCLKPVAERILSGDIPGWRASENRWDWLGHGIYFWEWSLSRAWRWAQDKAKKEGGEPAVIGALIQLDRCFDLTDERFTQMLGVSYRLLEREFTVKGEQLPENSTDHMRRERDCLVINAMLDLVKPETFTAVRAPFWEGPPAYPGAELRVHTHVQVAVRDRSCILGVFRPNL